MICHISFMVYLLSELSSIFFAEAFLHEAMKESHRQNLDVYDELTPCSLIRRSDCQSARCQAFRDEEDMASRWKAEVEAEQKRRYHH